MTDSKHAFRFPLGAGTTKYSVVVPGAVCASDDRPYFIFSTSGAPKHLADATPRQAMRAWTAIQQTRSALDDQYERLKNMVPSHRIVDDERRILQSLLEDVVQRSERTMLPNWHNDTSAVVTGEALEMLVALSAEVPRVTETRGARSTHVVGLLKALGIDTDAISKKEREKIRDELFNVFKEFAAQEGLVSLAPVANDAIQATEVDRPLNPEPGYEAAIRKGAEFRTATLQRDGMLSSEAIAKTLGLSRQAIWARRKAKQLLGLSSGRSVRYPAWQLAPNVAPHVPPILELLGRLGDWAVYLFMTRPNALLNDATPLEALESGASDRVLEAVQSYAASMA